MTARFVTAAGLAALCLLTAAPETACARPATGRGSAASPELQAFVSRVVRQLNGAGEAPESDVDPVFSRLFGDNVDLAGERLHGYDFRNDPVCQCFESGNDHYTLVSLTQRSPTSAEARIRYGSPASAYTLVLEHFSRHWRIRDALTVTGSNRAILTRHNACMRASHDEAQIRRCFGDD